MMGIDQELGQIKAQVKVEVVVEQEEAPVKDLGEFPHASALIVVMKNLIRGELLAYKNPVQVVGPEWWERDDSIIPFLRLQGVIWGFLRGI